MSMIFGKTIKFGLISSLVILTACSENDSASQMTPPPSPVGVVELAQQSLSLTTELPGRTQAYRIAEIRPRINGIIEGRRFQEGGEVEAGQVLYQIESSAYRAAVAAADAAVKQAQATLELSRLRHDRLQPLVSRQSVSQQEFDEASANLSQDEAALAAAQAQLQAAQINLDYTQIKSPIAGRIGKSEFTEGALVTALQSAPLATVRQLDPIYVEVSQSADNLLKLRNQARQLGAEPEGLTDVKLILADGSYYSETGQLEFSEVNVDESTGTVILRALFPNPDQQLLPGMFVRAEITELSLEQALLVPQRAVMRNPDGSASVLIANDQGLVEPRSLTLRRAVGDQWLVEGGLEPGDKVLVDSLQKVQPGMPVSPVPVNSESQN